VEDSITSLDGEQSSKMAEGDKAEMAEGDKAEMAEGDMASDENDANSSANWDSGTAVGSWEWYQQQLKNLTIRIPTAHSTSSGVHVGTHTHFACDTGGIPERQSKDNIPTGEGALPSDDVDVNVNWMTETDNCDY
jgi:hypothetical protein